MKRRIIAVLLATTMVLGLTACGGGDNVEKDDGKESDGIDWSAGADASDGDVKLRIATWRKSDKPYYEELIKKFEEKYDWIDVEIEVDPSSGSYYSNLHADLSDGVAPDVFDLHPADRLKVYAEDGLILPQTEFNYMENYLDFAKQITTFEGENYAFMQAYNFFGFLYNLEIFEKLNLTVPTTPEEFVKVVEALKKAGYGGVVYAGSTYGSDGLKNATCSLRLGSEGYSALKEGIDDGSITDITTVDGVTDVLDTLQYYAQKDIFYTAFENINYDSGMSLFAQQKAAIIYTGSYAIGEQATYFPGIDVGYFVVPVYNGIGASYGEGAQCSVVNAAGENIGAAKLWIEFLATPENSGYFCSNAKMLSTINGAEVDFPEYEILTENAKDFALIQIEEPRHSEYWSMGFQDLFDNIIFEAADWKPLADQFHRKLEDYDLKSLEK